jgi:tight adherence protein C
MNYLTYGSAALAALTIFLSFSLPSKTSLSAKLKPRERISTNKVRDSKFNSLNALMEIPDFASLLWFAVSAGESLEVALRISVSRSTGYVSKEFEGVLRNVDHGALLALELQNLAFESKSDYVKELAMKLSVALGNGSALSELLGDFVQSATASLRTELLSKAGKNETKMMIPTVFVILPVTVMFALYPSLALIQGSFL